MAANLCSSHRVYIAPEDFDSGFEAKYEVFASVTQKKAGRKSGLSQYQQF